MVATAPLVRIEQHDRVWHLVIDNPPVNALSNRCLSALTNAVADALAGGARAILLRSAGSKAFVAGADLRELAVFLADEAQATVHTSLTRGLTDLLSGCAAPVVVAVHGDALGGGLELALACDIVLLDERARVGLPEARLGLIPGAGGTARVTAAAGVLRAKDLMLSGRLVDASEAFQLGLATEVCAAGTTASRAIELCDRLAGSAPASIGAIKRLVGRSAELIEALDREQGEFLEILRSEDAREGCAAFLEKRPPIFTPTPEGA